MEVRGRICGEASQKSCVGVNRWVYDSEILVRGGSGRVSSCVHGKGFVVVGMWRGVRIWVCDCLCGGFFAEGFHGSNAKGLAEGACRWFEGFSRRGFV